MTNKDHFSSQAQSYAAFRPTYPAELYQFLFSQLPARGCAWDCATGNGQVAQFLSLHFKSVYASDISQQQIRHAYQAPNIFYTVNPAEKISFPDNQFDLITVAQALHWFDIPAFYQEARRTGKPGSLLAVWGYALPAITRDIDAVLFHFYHHIVGPYWDPARRLVENQYCDIEFPFESVETPQFDIRTRWTADQFCGYLTSWSATQQYIRTHNADPVKEVKEILSKHWPSTQQLPVTFPVFMKAGKISH